MKKKRTLVKKHKRRTKSGNVTVVKQHYRKYESKKKQKKPKKRAITRRDARLTKEIMKKIDRGFDAWKDIWNKEEVAKLKRKDLLNLILQTSDDNYEVYYKFEVGTSFFTEAKSAVSVQDEAYDELQNEVDAQPWKLASKLADNIKEFKMTGEWYSPQLNFYTEDMEDIAPYKFLSREITKIPDPVTFLDWYRPIIRAFKDKMVSKEQLKNLLDSMEEQRATIKINYKNYPEDYLIHVEKMDLFKNEAQKLIA
jgi:hypothetical protein